jgi:hypothetical protein
VICALSLRVQEPCRAEPRAVRRAWAPCVLTRVPRILTHNLAVVLSRLLDLNPVAIAAGHKSSLPSAALQCAMRRHGKP